MGGYCLWNVELTQCVCDLGDRDVLGMSEVVIKVGLGVVGWILPFVCGSNPVVKA